MKPSDRDALILHYAAISAQGLLEKDPVVLESIRLERRDIEERLGIPMEEIILAAKRLLMG